MKKFTCLLMSLLLALSLLCCGASAESAAMNPVGTWYGDLFGIVLTLTINEDNTYQIEADHIAPYFGTWKLNDEELLLDEGTENEIALPSSADRLTVSHEGLNILFTREIPQPFVPAEARTDAALGEFSGEWSMTHLAVSDLVFAPTMLDMHLSLSISEGNALVFISFEDLASAILGSTQPMPSENSPESTEEEQLYSFEMTGALENGVLTLTEVLAEDVAEEEIPLVWTVQLLLDGTMSITEITDPLLPVTYYATPIMPLMLFE